MKLLTYLRNWFAGLWAAKKTEQAKKEIAGVVEDVVIQVDRVRRQRPLLRPLFRASPPVVSNLLHVRDQACLSGLQHGRHIRSRHGRPR